MPTSASLRRGDIVSEVVHGEVVDRDFLRDIKVEKVEDGYTWYRDDWHPVIYVYGIDIASQKKVAYTRTLRFQWMNVIRAGSSVTA